MANDLTHVDQRKATPQANVRPSRRFKFDLMDPDSLEHIWRVAGMYSASALFPKHLRGNSPEEARANAVMVMNIADRLGEDTLTVANHVYFVGNKAGWAASYMINRANQYGIFKNPIDWEIDGEGESLEVTAHAEMAATGKRVSKKITFKQAKQEGWTSNKKYQTMPETMLQYRSATALIRLYCPEVMQGMPVVEEGDEASRSNIRDVTPDAPADLTDALPEAPAQTARGKVDRTPPPAATAESEDAQEYTEDPGAARIYGHNDGQHKRRTKEQMAVDTELEKLADQIEEASGEQVTIPTDRPANDVLADLRRRWAEIKPTQSTTAPGNTPENREALDVSRTIEKIEADLLDGMAPDVAMRSYKEALERIAQSDMEGYRRVIELVDSYRPQGAPEGGGSGQSQPTEPAQAGPVNFGQHEQIAQAIRSDAKEAGASAAISFYNDALEQMKVDVPEAHDALMKEIGAE